MKTITPLYLFFVHLFILAIIALSIFAVTHSALVGDANGDGYVDGQDIAIMQANFTGSLVPHTGGKTLEQGDTDDDQDVDGNDEAAWATHYTGPAPVATSTPITFTMNSNPGFQGSGGQCVQFFPKELGGGQTACWTEIWGVR